jgi:hypothetical protein
MKPVTALVMTMAAAVAAAAFDSSARAIFCVGAVVGHIFITRRLRGGTQFLLWGIVFALPLLIMHAILNPAYPITGKVVGVVPWRDSGLAFATRQVSLVMTLFVPALYWLAVSREGVIALLCRLPISPAAAVPLFDVMALLTEMERRTATILEAQRARGIKMNGAPWRKAAALMALVVPLVAMQLRDAPVRARIRCNLQTSEAAFASQRTTRILSLFELLICVAFVGTASFGAVAALP